MPQTNLVFLLAFKKRFGPFLAFLARFDVLLKCSSGNPVYEKVNVLRTRYDWYQI